MNSSYSRKFEHGRSLFCAAAVLMGLLFALGSATRLHAQASGWEGETGVFVTPLAYTASSETQKFHPVVAYHYLNAGSVIGDFHETSIELGVGKRIEFGYEHEFHVFGSNTDLSYLWQDGFDIFNGKLIVLPENSFKTKWIPAVSGGFLIRPNVRNVGNFVEMLGQTQPYKMGGKHNEDFYGVATKLIPIKYVPILLTGGVRGTNAELWGMGGNAPDWKARAFGSVAFIFKGPGKSSIVFASEAAQQPHHPYNFDGKNGTTPLNIPTTITYAVRVTPISKYKLNFDLGVAQIAGRVNPAVDLKARHQVGVQMTYGF